MHNLQILIPAAGESKRFKEEGYDSPKALLYLKSSDGVVKDMLTHVIDTLPQEKDSLGWPIPITIALSSNQEKWVVGNSITIKWIDKTIGQADTILQSIKDLKDEDSILICDCDMLLKKEDLKQLVWLLLGYDVTIAVSETFDPNASRVDQVPFPKMFVEKEPISQYGIIGARAFRSIGKLKQALKKTLEDCEKLNIEPYLSMAINNYVGTKYALLINEFVDLGTPERIRKAGWEII